jgi:hypothetical protein|tara:strand:- start:5534 stop:5899 length:366 start_codon:yes stop_codon:yes gene_type:complete
MDINAHLNRLTVLKPIARNSDPATSHQAARKVRRTKGVEDAIKRVKAHPYETAGEHVQRAVDAGMLVCEATGISKRISDAEQIGYIHSPFSRKDRYSKKNGRVWVFASDDILIDGEPWVAK